MFQDLSSLPTLVPLPFPKSPLIFSAIILSFDVSLAQRICVETLFGSPLDNRSSESGDYPPQSAPRGR